MIKGTFLIFLFTCLTAQCSKAPALSSLDSLKWNNRILVIHEPKISKAITKQLKSAKAEIDDRDIIWFLIQDDTLTSNYSGNLAKDLATRLKASYFKNGEHTILIGKDGGIKAHYPRLELKKAFALIDTMPMRKREMQE